MIHETKIRQRIAGKRKRIQLDPNLKQGYPNKREEVTMPDDLYKKHDDAVPDKIHVDAEKGEELKEKVLSQGDSE